MKKFPIYTLVIFIAIAIFRTPSASAQIASTNIELTASPKQSSVGRIGVTLSGVELEDAFQRQSKSRGLNPAVFREELVGALKELHPGTIGMEFPDLSQQLAGGLSISGASVNADSASSSRYGLGEFLQLCVEVGSDPWLRIPSGTTPEQMRELVLYLSGTGSDAWTAARVAGGQSDPWTQVFGKIHVELGNESGSAAADAEHMEAGAYAERANADFGAARQVAGFDGSKFDLMLSGAGVSPQWAAAALAQSHEQDSVAITADLPWNAAGAQQSELFGALLAEPEAMDSSGGILSREVTGLAMTTSTSASGTSVNVGRSQLSLAAGGSEQLAQSWGASLAQAEHVLQMMAMGVRYQNGAVLTESNLHCVSASQTANCRGAQLLTAALANGAIGGTMLQALQTGANPSWSQVVNGEQVQAHALQSFAFSEGGKVSLVVFNLSRTAELPLTLSGTNAPAGDVQMAQIAPREITASNESGTELQPSTQTLSASDVSGGLSLPPFSMTVLSWEAGSGVKTASSAVSGTVKTSSSIAKPTVTESLTAQSTASASTASSQPLINCPNGFTTTPGSQCYIASYLVNGTAPANNFGRVDYIPQLVGSAENLQAASGTGHTSAAMNFMEQVSTLAFTTTFQFVPNGWNIALVFNNNLNNSTFNQIAYVAGAGVEGGFYQNPPSPHPGNPSAVYAIQFDQGGALPAGASSWDWTYSAVQQYVSGQYPGNPNLSSSLYFGTNKISTSPVPLNSPAAFTGSISGTTLTVTSVSSGRILLGATIFGNTVGDNTVITGLGTGTGGTGTYTVSLSQTIPSEALTTGINTTTGDTYSTTISYDGSNLNLCLYDVTAANGSCSSATSGTGTYFQHTWTNVNIPAEVGGTYAWMGLTASTNSTVPWNLLVNSFTYTANTPANSPPFTAYNANSTTHNATTNATASPVYSVAPGTYSSPQTVTVTSSTSGSNICTVFVPTASTLTTLPVPDNQGGCSWGTAYAAPISITQSGTLYAVAGTNYTAPPSTTVAGVYTIGGTQTAATPVFSVATGTYATAQTVSISDATSGATIYYTTNGTTPTTSSTRYTGAITVGATETIEAVAVATGYANSPAAAAAYTITAATLPAAPTFSPAAGTYTGAQTVKISDSTTGATIYYTTNGTAPSTSSTVYSSPIMVSATETLEAIAVTAVSAAQVKANATDSTSSPIAAAAYTIASVLPAPVFSLVAGTYTQSQNVWINDATEGTTIYYTTNGSTPTTSSTKYTGPIAVTETEKVEAIAVETGHTNSAVGTAAYTINSPAAVLAAPTFSPATGTYTASQVVKISDATAGTTIYYTTNGTTPTTSSRKYTSPITVSASSTLKAIAVKTGATNFPLAAAAYTIVPILPAPVFSLAAGTYTKSQNLWINDATAGTTIYYTTNGTTPTTSSTKYTGPIAVTETEKVEAIAVKTGRTNSPIGSALFTIVVATPSFSISSGAYTKTQKVTISDTTAGATIYYTTSGATPTTASTKYTGAIKMTATQELKALAIASGKADSPIASAT